MKALNQDIIQFFKRQSFVIVSTLDKKGSLHNSCKGIVKIDRRGLIYLFDLYKGKTYENLECNSNISITAVDERQFEGYCLKGKAKIIKKNKFSPSLIRAWEERLSARITQRLLNNIHGQKGHRAQPEAILPEPEYLVLIAVKRIIDLTPQPLKDN